MPVFSAAATILSCQPVDFIGITKKPAEQSVNLGTILPESGPLRPVTMLIFVLSLDDRDHGKTTTDRCPARLPEETGSATEQAPFQENASLGWRQRGLLAPSTFSANNLFAKNIFLLL